MKQRTKTWVALAENDLSLAGELLKKKGRAYYAAHFCHQAIREDDKGGYIGKNR